jgi:hypothetical protein
MARLLMDREAQGDSRSSLRAAVGWRAGVFASAPTAAASVRSGVESRPFGFLTRSVSPFESADGKRQSLTPFEGVRVSARFGILQRGEAERA